MGSILIAMPKMEDANKIAKIVHSSGMSFQVDICSMGAEVLRTSHDRDFGVVICTKRLRDMNYTDLEEYLPSFFGLIVLTSDASLETRSDRCVKLMYPLKRSDLTATIEMMTSGFYRQRKKKKQAPKKRDEKEQKMIDQAKALLMERNGMTEPEAFRYLQKNSMDYSRSMVESAQMILVMSE